MKTWEFNYDYKKLGNLFDRTMPFMPKDGYVSYQNPPDFTWLGVEDAEKYDLIIATDKELNNIKYSVYGLEYNFHNFNITFDVGVRYYWAVRYYKDGIPTGWSMARSFRIHPSAKEFTVPDIDTMLGKIGKGHPRICTTENELAEFRALRYKNKNAARIADNYIQKAEEAIAEGEIGEEPKCPYVPDLVQRTENHSAFRRRVDTIISKLFYCAFSYLLTGDKRYSAFGVKLLLFISSWDINGDTSYQNQDQIHRAIAYKGAMAYDWLYDAMTEDERRLVLDMVSARTKVMEYLLDGLKRFPYDSHGWTAFGYIGIIGIATYGEIPEAGSWLRQVIPQYTVILPPWSHEDGGWSQGSAYWGYSTGSNQELMSILCKAGIINLYNKAWAQNEYLWSLYPYYFGGYGVFGDESGIERPSHLYSMPSLYRNAYFGNNPVAKYLAEEYGELGVGYSNYMISEISEMKSVAPIGYPKAHHFRDIDWVTMASDIMTPERISMTFKSSPFGSFNHSHADQNAFLVNAFGESLAINSGYYDAYYSKHDSGVTRESYAHNTVTLSKSRGQNKGLMSASGSITSFLNSKNFALAGGDATPAYYGALNKFCRHIIYVRPDIFVIVDDLATNGESESFEWWLNALNPIDISEDGRCVTVKSNKAVLNADAHYPIGIKAHALNNCYRGSSGNEIAPEGRFANASPQSRAYFETEAATSTKIVVTLDIHKDGEAKKNISTEIHESYLKLLIDGKTSVYVNLTCQNDLILTDDGVEFDGACAVFNSESAMLAEGTVLAKDGKKIIEFNSAASAVVGDGELGIYGACDNRLALGTNTAFFKKPSELKDINGLPADYKIGITSITELENQYVLELLSGEYSLKSDS